DAHKERHGSWPKSTSGPIPEAPGESWRIIERNLASGRRGLPAGSSLAQLFSEHRGWRSTSHLPPLTVPQIVAWIHSFRARTGRWPTADSGAIPDYGGDTWGTIDYALKKGNRGLPGGFSLAGLVDQSARESAAPRRQRTPKEFRFSSQPQA